MTGGFDPATPNKICEGLAAYLDQVKVSRVASLTGLDFGPLVAADPLARGGFEAAGREAIEVTGPESLVI